MCALRMADTVLWVSQLSPLTDPTCEEYPTVYILNKLDKYINYFSSAFYCSLVTDTPDN